MTTDYKYETSNDDANVNIIRPKNRKLNVKRQNFQTLQNGNQILFVELFKLVNFLSAFVIIEIGVKIKCDAFLFLEFNISTNSMNRVIFKTDI